MLQLRLSLLCSILSLSLVTLAQREAATPTRQLSLSACIGEALQRNLDVRLTRIDEAEAAAQATRANAGQLPEVSLSAGYTATSDPLRTTRLRDGSTQRTHGALEGTFSAGLNASYTLFDGFKMQTTYKRLQELRTLGEIQTRIAVEDMAAAVAAEYTDVVYRQQRLNVYTHAAALSRERVRIARTRYLIGSASRLDVLQAQVDYNADSAACLTQRQALREATIGLGKLLACDSITTQPTDTVIIPATGLDRDTLLARTLLHNATLLRAARERRLSDLDYQATLARDYPYIRLNANYGYARTDLNTGSTRSRDNVGGDLGITVGMKLFDGKRTSERRTAALGRDRAALREEQLRLALRTQLATLHTGYANHLALVQLEEQNLKAARTNYEAAHARYMLEDLSGIELREAQQSLLAAQERLLAARYDVKLCEISLRQLSGDVLRYLAPEGAR